MKGLIEVNVVEYSDGMGVSKKIEDKMLININEIKGVCGNVIKANEFGSRLFYTCKETYEEIKKKIEEAQ